MVFGRGRAARAVRVRFRAGAGKLPRACERQDEAGVGVFRCSPCRRGAAEARAGRQGDGQGHKEEDESPQQAAERELAEETGLRMVRYMSNEPLSESYIYLLDNQSVHKEVFYFVGEVEGALSVQAEELYEARWHTFQAARDALSFQESKTLLERTSALLAQH